MSSHSQWYWDGAWHPYPKNKQPMPIETLPMFESQGFIPFNGGSWAEFERWQAYWLAQFFRIPSHPLQSGNLTNAEREQQARGNHTGRVHNPPKTAS